MTGFILFSSMSIVGFVLSSVGGLGAELLDSFAGRSFEAYCRLSKNRERFRSVLTWQDAAIRGSEYLRMIGTVLFLIAGTAAFMVLNLEAIAAGADRGLGLAWLLDGWQWFVGWITFATLMMMFVHSWIPEVVTRFASTTLLYHTWPFWHTLALAMNPLSTPRRMLESLTLRLSGKKEAEDEEEESLEDEIRTIVAAGTNAGFFGPGVREMIQNVMELDNDVVKGIMTVRTDIDALERKTSWPEVMQQVMASGRTRLPVYDGTLDNVIGVLYVKDLLPELAGGRTPTRPLEELVRRCWTVPADRTVSALLREFLHSRSHMAIVLDEFQHTVGVVTIEDALEEIVGEIVDESDEEEEIQFKVVDESTAILSGRVMIDDINERLNWHLPESDDYQTIAGMVLSHLGEIPENDAKFTIGDIQFHVLQASRQTITMVQVHYEPAEV